MHNVAIMYVNQIWLITELYFCVRNDSDLMVEVEIVHWYIL